MAITKYEDHIDPITPRELVSLLVIGAVGWLVLLVYVWILFHLVRA